MEKLHILIYHGDHVFVEGEGNIRKFYGNSWMTVIVDGGLYGAHPSNVFIKYNDDRMNLGEKKAV